MKLNNMLKFIKSLFKKKINPKPTGNKTFVFKRPGNVTITDQEVKIWNPDLDLPGNYVKVEDDLMTQKYKAFAERKHNEINTYKPPVKDDRSHSQRLEDNLNIGYTNTDDCTSYIYNSPCTNHDSYSYDQDNSNNDSSSDSSPEFGGGDFGGGGAGGDW